MSPSAADLVARMPPRGCEQPGRTGRLPRRAIATVSSSAEVRVPNTARGAGGASGRRVRGVARLFVAIVILPGIAVVVGGSAASARTSSSRGSVRVQNEKPPARVSASHREPKSVQLSVAPCPIPLADYAGTSMTPQAAPPTERVAASLVPPKGARLYGTQFPGNSDSYLIGAGSGTCQAIWASADGGEFMAATSASGAFQHVMMVINAGGVGPETDLACPYIPAVLDADRAMRGNAALCVRPSRDVVRLISTDSSDLYAAVVWVPPKVKDPNLSGSGNRTDPTVALFTARVVPVLPGNTTPTAVGQMITCTLPPAKRNVCTASLRFFLATQSNVGTLVGKGKLARMNHQLSSFLARH